MKTFFLVVLAAMIACTSAFAPMASVKPAFKSAPLAVSPMEETETSASPNAAAVAAFATAMAPFAAYAEGTVVDEGTIIGYGAGLVACVVSLAVGFSIGYGTLVKP